MDTTDPIPTPPALRVVRPDEPAPTDAPPPSAEDYWARVQALRDDLARLRPVG
jgi:hypothetical protein